MRDKLTGLVHTVRALLAEDITEVEMVTDVWLTLCGGDQRAAAFMGATAIVRLAKTEQPGARMASEPDG